MFINTVCVCGAGTMGSGIALAAAQSGFFTLLYEVNKPVLEKSKVDTEKSLSRLQEKGKISAEEKDSILKRIHYTEDIQECLADVFIEAIVEKPDLKIALFNQLAELNHSESVFATNTSSLSVSRIAEQVMSPQRVIGMHFFNPPTIMKLVEVVVAEQTNVSTQNTIMELSRQMGKTPVVCKDSPGFIVNRVARPFYIETLYLVQQGYINIEQADQLLEACGFKMGPFKLMDLIGNDINYAVSCSVYEQLHQPERLRPSPIQEELVNNGKLGKKSGEGYYKYDT